MTQHQIISGGEMTGWLQPICVLAAEPEQDLPLSEGMTAVWPDAQHIWRARRENGQEFTPTTLRYHATQADFAAAFASQYPVLIIGENGKPQGMASAAAFCERILQERNRSVALVGAVLDAADELICAIDEHGIVTVFNARAEQIYKIKREEIVGKPVTDFFSDLLITQVQQNAISSGQVVRDQYHQPVFGAHVLCNAGPVLMQGRVIGAVTAEREITETMRLSNELARSNTQVSNLQREIMKINRPADAFGKIHGQSAALTGVVDMAKRIAHTDVSILLRGESGTGKELFAEAIHRASSRHDKPFVVINCGAIPFNLFESELFGYLPGSFTGADRRGRKGKFDEANHGTLFLDEIGELPLDMQVKLLRVLQNQRFYRVGGGDPIAVDVRVISATNRPLEKMIEDGLFRDDLYYRINVVSLEIPPLRERKEDISQLVWLFVRECCMKQGIPAKHIEPEVIDIMRRYSWPGNIRELRNVAERMVVLSEGSNITVDNLPSLIKYEEDGGFSDEFGCLLDITDKTERDLIVQALEKCGNDRSRAAKMLGIPRSTLYYKLNKYRLQGKYGKVSKKST